MTLTEVLGSPALPLLLRLEARGCDVSVRGDRLIVEPSSRLDGSERAAVLVHRRALAVLIQACDPAVVVRRAVFAQQLASTPSLRMPSFLLRPEEPYVHGRCFSCGDELERPRFGRCWRCALAWRLVCGLTVVDKAGIRHP